MKYTKELHLAHVAAFWEGRLQKIAKTKPEVEWIDAPNPPAHDHEPDYYRIRPERKLRPWKPEEAIGKHVQHKNGRGLAIVHTVDHSGCSAGSFGNYSYTELLDLFTQLDGSPCGVEEEV